MEEATSRKIGVDTRVEKRCDSSHQWHKRDRIEIKKTIKKIQIARELSNIWEKIVQAIQNISNWGSKRATTISWGKKENYRVGRRKQTPVLAVLKP